MNKAFEHNGTVVSMSRPVKQLKTVKKTLLIDSADRDTIKYYTNGDVVYYLPRVYENVISIRLKSATFTPIAAQVTSPPITASLAMAHSYSDGQNIVTATWSSDAQTGNTVNYFFIDIEGLNKNDETVVDAQRSSLVDSFFARIPVETVTNPAGRTFISYNDNTHEENIAKYSPAISKLDRLHIVTRLHSQQNKSGFIYWTSSGTYATENNRNNNYSLVLELEMLENGFDEFSTFESRIHNREFGNFGC